MRKISVPYSKDNRTIDLIDTTTLPYISEIYMPLPYDIMPSGRFYVPSEQKEYKEIFDTQIQKANDIDLKVNVLASKPILDIDNGVSLMNKTVRELERIKPIGASKVTIGSLTFLKIYGKYIKEMGYEIELSVLANIDCYEKVEQVMTIHPYVDSICLTNNLIHNLDELKYIKSLYPNLKLKILANHLCMYKCVSHVEHHNLYSNLIVPPSTVDTTNLSEWRLASNAGQLIPNCKSCTFYSNIKDVNAIKNTSFIRPEDLNIYDDVIDLFKLSGREHPSEFIMQYVKAYGERQWSGMIMDIVDVPMPLPKIINNTKFPDDYGITKSKCEHKCYKCGYCDTIIINNKILEDYPANNPQ